MSDLFLRGDAAPPAPLHLRDYWHVLARRRRLAFLVFLLIAALGAAWVSLVRPTYRATSKILIERDVPSVVDFDRNPRRASELWEDFYQTQYKILESRLLARKAVERLHLLNDPEFGGPRGEGERTAAEAAKPGASPVMERAIDTFLGRLDVEPIKNSQLVALHFRAFRPELAAEAANALASLYIEQTLDFRYRVSADAGSWLVNEAQEQAAAVAAAEKDLQEFREREGLVNIEERRVLLEQRLRDLGSSLTAAKTRRLDKEALYRQMQSVRNPEELPDVIRSPLIQGLLTELAGLERQAAQLAAKGYLEEHPEVVRLREQTRGTRERIASEAARIVRAAENDYQAAAAQEGSVASALEGAKKEAQELSQRGLRYDALKRDLEASRVVSDSLVQRQKQSDVVRDVKASTIHIIDPAVTPSTPIRPQPRRDLILAVLLGLGCAVAAAFLGDYLDTSVGRPGDIRSLGLPVLGVIPETRMRGGAPILLSARRVDEPFQEGYRVLRTALQPAELGDEAGQVLVVTSARAGEGKTLTVVNLGQSLALARERVLLVDADLRRPALTTVLQARPEPGLCEVLNGRAHLERAIQRIPGTRLSVLPAGDSARTTTSDLLAGPAMRDLLGALRRSYDRIIIDTPPAGSIADALILSRHADGVLVVAHSGHLARSELLHVLERLENAGAKVLGVVLNRTRPDDQRYDYAPVFAEAAGGERRYAIEGNHLVRDVSRRRFS